MPTTEKPTLESRIDNIQRLLNIVVAIVVVIGIAVSVNGYLTFSNSAESTDALCKLRVDLEKRTDGSREFLRANPNGTPGIPAGLIRKSISDQQQTITALASLDCPTPPVK